ncbi:YdeI/OmpD-associated family protein [Streptomyces sp. WG5]|uniref:YdeI/OmpD-associated family protein n=1 Tax=Streptomyces sp. WG5 TaxID=3417648 RepID=UPI003CE93300
MEQFHGVEAVAFPDAAAFDALDRTARYLVMLVLLQAATSETRRTRLGRAVRDLVEGRQVDEG